MKKILSKIIAIATIAAPLAMALPAQAVYVPDWDVKGNYQWLVLGAYSHDISITAQNSDGTFSGTGGYPAGGPYATTEVITGQVTGNSITFTTTYNGPYNPGYSVTVSGTIAADGTMSGTSPWEWHMTAGSARLADEPEFDGQLEPSACEGRIGSPVINVTQKVINDVDSGMAGNWAIDKYNRHIQVWSTGDDTYCALVSYEGKAKAVAGQTGPGGSQTIGTGVVAEMEGGYRAAFSGTLNPNPVWKTKGSIGSFDYGCDISGACGTRPSWLSAYFTGAGGSFNQVWWGWFYDAEEHGIWLNSSDGTYGNIY